jgi:DNA adenine methylase
LQGQEFRRYVEPFLGGGAMFFGLRPSLANLSDVNAELINVYQQVARNPRKLLRSLQDLPVTQDTFLSLRAENTGSPGRRAVRFLYLNRTAFGGMYRVNRQGQFNVPYGGGHRTPAPLWTDRLLCRAASRLGTATVEVLDFEVALSAAQDGDLVYCDPTYTVTHDNNGFVRYNETNFSWADQRRLASGATAAAGRGATVLVSNAHHPDIRALYPDADIHTVYRASCLCPDPEKRRRAAEYLVVLTPPGVRLPPTRIPPNGVDSIVAS